jgi:rubrerythrin
MKIFTCPRCRVRWQQNEAGRLLPDLYGSMGHWSNEDENPQNCPECEPWTSAVLPVWTWVNTRE